MAAAAAELAADGVAGGVVALPGRMPALPGRILRFRAGHPLPDRESLAAGRAVWRLLGQAGEGDVVLLLLSGGASSLLALPAPGLTLTDERRTTELLLGSGAGIAEINAVRKHLSRLKGGGLARRARPADVVGLALSDVIGSSPAVIGSGPGAADPSTFADAWRVLARRGLVDRVSTRVRHHLEQGMRGSVPDTPKPGTLRSRHVVIGDVATALAAAAARARQLGYEPIVATAAMRGETRGAARRFARTVATVARAKRRAVCVLAGGETTVTVTGPGRGGRNQEFALALVEDAAALPGFSCLSAGTDGIDGPTDAAGAFVDASTRERARRRHLDPSRFLADNDSHAFFARLGDLFRPGPTGTNVMDLKIALVG
jgi:hydroxypyruvate reductase